MFAAHSYQEKLSLFENHCISELNNRYFFNPKGLKMSSVQSDIFHSTTLLNQDFSVVHTVVCVCVCLCACVCVRQRERERVCSLTGNPSIHTVGTIVGNSHIHNNLCSCQPISLKNTFPCILPMKAKNFKLCTK